MMFWFCSLILCKITDFPRNDKTIGQENVLLKPEIALERQLSVRNTMKGVWAEQRNVFLTNCHIFVHFCDTLIFQDYEKKAV